MKRLPPIDLSRILAKFERRNPRDIAEWAESEVRIDGSKPFRWAFAPYLREMVRAPFDPLTYLTAYMVFSRGGKSTLANLVMGYCMAEQPRRILMMRQTIQKAEVYSKANFMQDFVNATPALKRLIDVSRFSGNTIRHRMFPGGEVRFFGSNAPGDLREAKGNLLIADEIDSYEGNKGDEGDILKIFWKRGSEYDDTIRMAMSYPGVEGESSVGAIMAQSDWRKYWIPCPHCEEMFVPDRQHITWPEGEPEEAVFSCPLCGRGIADWMRRDAVAQGEWRASQKFRGVAGFHASAMLWPHPVPEQFRNFYHMLAAEVEAAKKADDVSRSMRVIVNTFDALPYREEVLPVPDTELIFGRRESYNPRSKLPTGVLFLTAGVDVQETWLEVTVLGHGILKHRWALEHKRIDGKVDNPDTWDRLLSYLKSCNFEHPSGATLGLLARNHQPRVFVDSRHKSETVRAWAKKNEVFGIYAVTGSNQLDETIVIGHRNDPVTLARIYRIGVNVAKERIYESVGKTNMEEEGFWHFPSLPCYDQEYFNGLLGEEPRHAKKDGKLFTKFSTPDGLRNEPLDTAVYALAAFVASKAKLAAPNLIVQRPAPAKISAGYLSGAGGGFGAGFGGPKFGGFPK